MNFEILPPLLNYCVADHLLECPISQLGGHNFHHCFWATHDSKECSNSLPPSQLPPLSTIFAGRGSSSSFLKSFGGAVTDADGRTMESGKRRFASAIAASRSAAGTPLFSVGRAFTHPDHPDGCTVRFFINFHLIVGYSDTLEMWKKCHCNRLLL